MPPETVFPQCNGSHTAATTVCNVLTLPLPVPPVRPVCDYRQGGLIVEKVLHSARNPDRLASQEVLPIQSTDQDAGQCLLPATG